MSKALIFIFLAALVVRFLFFPTNIYFGYDQARDAFVSQEILHGHLKLVGPTTSIPGLFHGPLFYYLWAPLYFISHGDPTMLTVFLRIYNLLGIIVIFWLGKLLFSKRVGLLSALLYAFSFEQSQYAIYMTHPALAVPTVLLFYMGLVYLIFKKEKRGLILSAIFLGLSIQFEFGLIYLIGTFLLIIILFFRSIPKLDLKTILFSILGFLLSISTFIISTIKFHFKTTSLISSSSSLYSPNNLGLIINNIHSELVRFFHDNIVSSSGLVDVVILVYLLAVVWLIRKKDLRSKLLFLGIWLFSGIFPYINNASGSPLYYYAIAATSALIIFTSFIILEIWDKKKIFGVLITTLVIISNLYLIFTLNPKGSIPEINVQTGMLLSDEEKSIDYIYQNADSSFAVNALSMPYKINTTWSYLFEWYGQARYHRLPIWGGDNAEGYPGNLKVVKVRSSLPIIQFLILEPTRGIPQYLIDQFIHDENIFTKVIETKKFGDITVEKRIRF